MGMKAMDMYEKVIKAKKPEIAVEILATLCREYDKRIVQLMADVKNSVDRVAFLENLRAENRED